MIKHVHFFYREITVPNQRIKRMTHSVLPPASIIYREGPPYVACINSTTTLVTVTLHTVIWSPSLVQRGPWWCLGLTCIVHFHLSAVFPLPATLQWTRTHRIGICTAWAWHEWDPCKLIPLTGGQLAATQPMVWISETTSVATSRTSTSLIILGQDSARKLNTSTSAGTYACIWQRVSGRVPLTFGTLTAVVPAASLTRGLAQCQAKTTLALTVPSTQSSAATKGLIRPLSGGSELICKPFGI